MDTQESNYFSELEIRSAKHSQFLRLTDKIEEEIQHRGWYDGLLHIFIPHTTAGLTIQEDADPDVIKDILYVLDRIVPWHDPSYCHTEGNTAAHIKTALLGNSVHCNVKEGRLRLGRWQGIFLCEFDGPRTRKVQLTFLPFYR
ncbi:hypothetical protein A7Q09_09585 [Methylacidiphilum sp. Yel]|jgi:secondary thiamine-phosphate synthase enzyme|uniref:secondary thiamine-phosphate synthase enzyme YjbQ n=1 Tax=Methylacidiphilum sp. Yel TaxID=1847730 RepID=UPI00106BC653|nr:secondary thiamine-phosphate synthase enzyme YjbQ [Methylacidiphilum sp. Yel]TFE66755.1 hypothetical protein A7Q09_09585 [Methylacidiphilum sp. Yel]